jgi:hypothetical protein
LLAPLTRTGKKQEFREWWESVSNTARLKENIDYEVREIITKVENGLDKQSFDLWENSQQAKMYGKNKSLHFLAKILIK